MKNEGKIYGADDKIGFGKIGEEFCFFHREEGAITATGTSWPSLVDEIAVALLAGDGIRTTEEKHGERATVATVFCSFCSRGAAEGTYITPVCGAPGHLLVVHHDHAVITSAQSMQEILMKLLDGDLGEYNAVAAKAAKILAEVADDFVSFVENTKKTVKAKNEE